METMTERTPTTQTVLNAYRDAAWSSDNDNNHRYYKWSHTAGLAAALRTAASMVTEEFTPGQSTWGEGYYEGACKFNEYLKAIASELEGFD